MKKPFKETKFGRLLLEKIPSAVGVIGDVLPDKGILGVVKNIIEGSDLPPEEKKELLRMNQEYEKYMLELEIQDKANARLREVELAKAGGTDWLMYAAGITALGAFLLMVFAVIFLEVGENPLFHQLMGIIEGVALTIFGYYFGTSKGSKDKDKVISGRS